MRRFTDLPYDEVRGRLDSHLHDMMNGGSFDYHMQQVKLIIKQIQGLWPSATIEYRTRLEALVQRRNGNRGSGRNNGYHSI